MDGQGPCLRTDDETRPQLRAIVSSALGKQRAGLGPLSSPQRGRRVLWREQIARPVSKGALGRRGCEAPGDRTIEEAPTDMMRVDAAFIRSEDEQAMILVQVAASFVRNEPLAPVYGPSLSLLRPEGGGYRLGPSGLRFMTMRFMTMRFMTMRMMPVRFMPVDERAIDRARHVNDRDIVQGAAQPGQQGQHDPCLLQPQGVAESGGGRSVHRAQDAPLLGPED